MDERENARFRANMGDLQGYGATPGDALNALMGKATAGVDQPIQIVPYNQGDRFFTAGQHARLQELKGRLHSLSADERQELEELVAASFDATVARTQAFSTAKP